MKSPLKIEISRTHPLLILMAPCGINAHWAPAGSYEPEARAMVEGWESLDDLLRDHVTIQIEGICDDDWARNDQMLVFAQELGIPITLQVQTNSADINDTLPPDRVRRLLDAYPCIVGLQISEASQRTFVGSGAGPEHRMGRNARYACDIIRLAGEYGLFMSWQLMKENFAAIGCSADNEALFDTVREYGDYVIPTHEMNCEFSKHIDHAACMGLWLSSTTKHWGVEGQSWYWSDAGYNEPGCNIPGSLEMPGQVYSIMFLLGAIAGADTYSVEPPWDIWSGPGAHRFNDWIVPTFRRIVTEKLIPSKSDVLAGMPLAYHLQPCEKQIDFHAVSEDMDFDHGEGRIVRATLGVFDRARDAEMIPNDPRYTWIPILPVKTSQEVLDSFQRVLRPGEVACVEEARSIVEEYFPPVDRGEAWSWTSGPLTVAMNTHENWFVPESVKLRVPRTPTGIRFENDGGGYVLAWDRNPGDTGYHVWMRDDGETCLTDAPITESRLRVPSEDAAYCVSAITSDTEDMAGTLHLHDFVILDSKESRRSPWISADGVTTGSARFAESIPDSDDSIAAREQRCAECTPVEDLSSPVVQADDPQGQVKREVMISLTHLKHAIEAEDVDGVVGVYDADYREFDGRTTESLGVAFKSILRQHLPAAMTRLDKEWGVLPAWQNPIARVFVREWESVSDDVVESRCVFEIIAGGGPEMEPSDIFRCPLGREPIISMTWRKSADGWHVLATDPSILRMEDTIPFRFRYQGW
jgi:hypothetical protein